MPKLSAMQKALAALALLIPSLAFGQAPNCIVPQALPRIKLESPPADQVRRVPVAGYLLTLSWSPQYCRDKAASPADATQCASGARFGFVLHGLWPEGDGAAYPAWCRAADVIDEGLVRQHFCTTPSAQLLQHEWAKHGTCMTDRPEKYFQAASLLFKAVRTPDMNALSRRKPSVGAFASAFAQANPGLTPEMLRVTTNPGGWLEEVRMCLDRDFHPARCAKGGGAANPKRALRIWRNAR